MKSRRRRHRQGGRQTFRLSEKKARTWKKVNAWSLEGPDGVEAHGKGETKQEERRERRAGRKGNAEKTSHEPGEASSRRDLTSVGRKEKGPEASL